jgi:DNA-binding MarR family transcriptional regulator
VQVRSTGVGPGGYDVALARAGEVLVALVAVGRALKRSAAELPESLQQRTAALGLPVTGRHLGVLVVLAERAPKSVGDLANELHLSLPAASQVVAELVQAGLVRRREDEADHRRTLVEVDPARSGLVADLVEHRLGPLAGALAGLDDSGGRRLAGLLLELAAALEEASQRAEDEGQAWGKRERRAASEVRS